MRIIGGKARGMSLKTIEGDSTRPTRDMVREALFSILMAKVPESHFLDLFAGSGAVGLEALSRGAEFATFIDINPKCTLIIKENIVKAHFSECAQVFNVDYKKAISKLKEERYDLIYVDPPYNKEMGIDAIQRLSDGNVLKEDGIIVLETDTYEDVPEEIGRYVIFNYKRYGRNILSLLRRKG